MSAAIDVSKDGTHSDSVEIFDPYDTKILIQCIEYTLNTLPSFVNKNFEEFPITFVTRLLLRFSATYPNLSSTYAYEDCRALCRNILFDAVRRSIQNCRINEPELLMKLRDYCVVDMDYRGTPDYPVAALSLAHSTLDIFLDIAVRATTYIKAKDLPWKYHHQITITRDGLIKKWRASLQRLSSSCQQKMSLDSDHLDKAVLADLMLLFGKVGLHRPDEKSGPIEAEFEKQEGA